MGQSFQTYESALNGNKSPGLNIRAPTLGGDGSQSGELNPATGESHHEPIGPATAGNNGNEGNLLRMRRLFEHLRDASLKSAHELGSKVDPAWKELEEALKENSFDVLEAISKELRFTQWREDCEAEFKRLDHTIHSLRADLTSKVRKIQDLEVEITNYLASYRRRVDAEQQRNLRKRGRDRDSSPPDASSIPVKKRAKRTVVCTRCYQLERPCDDGIPCKYCAVDKERCKRSKCAHYKEGQCKRKQCTRAHADDKFPPEHLEKARHFSRLNYKNDVSKDTVDDGEARDDSGPSDDDGSPPPSLKVKEI